MASKEKLPEYLCRGDVCALLGIDGGLEELDEILSHCSWFHPREDGRIKLSVARQIVDKRGLERLREYRQLSHHPCQHEGHDVALNDVFGAYCRECGVPLFDWPESRALAQENQERAEETYQRLSFPAGGRVGE